MLGGVVMVMVAYFWGANALVTATAVSALVTMLWLLRRGIDGYVKTATASVFTLVYVPFLGSFVALMLAEGGATGFDRWDEGAKGIVVRSEEHTSELQSLMRISYAVFCL